MFVNTLKIAYLKDARYNAFQFLHKPEQWTYPGEIFASAEVSYFELVNTQIPTMKDGEVDVCSYSWEMCQCSTFSHIEAKWWSDTLSGVGKSDKINTQKLATFNNFVKQCFYISADKQNIPPQAYT